MSTSPHTEGNFVQNPRLCPTTCQGVSVAKNLQHFISCRHAHFPRFHAPDIPVSGNTSDGATPESKEALLVRGYESPPDRCATSEQRRKGGEGPEDISRNRPKADRSASASPWERRRAAVMAIGRPPMPGQPVCRPFSRAYGLKSRSLNLCSDGGPSRANAG